MLSRFAARSGLSFPRISHARLISSSSIASSTAQITQALNPVAAPTATKHAQQDVIGVHSHLSANKSFAEVVLNRFKVTAEVTVSKLFPGGFCWQYASILAGDLGLPATSAGFALMTGLGDFAGVLIGHTLYYALKSLVVKDVSVSQEAQNGLFLGSAAFFSGTAWQPVVNTLQAAGLPWVGVSLGTWALCGASFFIGLRVFRALYSKLGLSIAANSYSNLKTDASLSVAIGGATGAFVGTDVNYLPQQNIFIDQFGVQSTDSALAGCVKAGSSTAFGLAVSQSIQNVTYSKGKNWTD